jgi:hypothetical protein
MDVTRQYPVLLLKRRVILLPSTTSFDKRVVFVNLILFFFRLSVLYSLKPFLDKEEGSYP